MSAIKVDGKIILGAAQVNPVGRTIVSMDSDTWRAIRRLWTVAETLVDIQGHRPDMANLKAAVLRLNDIR